MARGAGASARSPYCTFGAADTGFDRWRSLGAVAAMTLDVAAGGCQPARAIAGADGHNGGADDRPGAAQRTLPPTTTEGPTTTAGPIYDRPDDDRGPTTTVAPTPIAPSAVYSANAECDPTIGETTVSWRLTNTGVTPVEIISTSAAGAVGTEPGSRLRLGFGDDDPRRSRHRSVVATTVTIDGGPAGPIELSDDITVPACHGPDAPPDVTFTFYVTPSESRAAR